LVSGLGGGAPVGGPPTAAPHPGLLGSGALVPSTVPDAAYSASSMGRRQRESEFQNLSDEEVSRRARDRSLPRAERCRYQREEKFRGLRDRRKRR
jgi:hypothetical protein